MHKNVPRIIHQTWKTTNIPKNWQKSSHQWKKLHPTWKYRLWTDKDLEKLIAADYTWFLKTYRELKYNIQKVDVARTFVLHKYGGVYSDLDVSPCISFEPFLKFFESSNTSHTVAITETPNAVGNKYLTNFLMFCVPKSKFWHRYWMYIQNQEWKQLKFYERLLMMQKHYYVLMTTGPTAISTVYNKELKEGNLNYHPQVQVIPNKLLNFLQTYREEQYRKKKIDKVKNQRFEQLLGNSWCDKSTLHANRTHWLWINRDYFVFPMLVLNFVLFITFFILFLRKQ